MKKSLFIMLGLVLVGSLFGLTYTETETFGPEVPDFAVTLNFDQYSAGNTLLSVTIETSLTVSGGSYAVDNESPSTASTTITLGAEALYPGGQADNNLTGVTTFTALSVTGGATYNLEATSGDPTDEYNNTGAGDHERYDGSTEVDSAEESVPALYFPTYTGSGTFDLYLDTSQVAEHTNSSGISYSGTPLSVSGWVKITYTDDEPLPVELSTFTATFANQELILQWMTQSESNNSHWNIYRSESDDFNQSYQVNASPIEGQGNSTESTNYVYHDINSTMSETSYWYWLESVDYSGENDLHGPANVTTPELSEPEAPPVQDVFGLVANYPNPFNPSTMIQFRLKETEPVELTIYNIRGRKVKTLHQGVVNAEVMTSILWDGTDDNANPVSSGLYFYKLVTPTRTEAKKMLLAK